MTQRNERRNNGVRQLLIIAVAALLANIGFSAYNDVRLTRKYAQQVEQNTNDLRHKIDKERVDEILSLMRRYHELSMEAIKTNDERYREEITAINKRIDDLLVENHLRGSKTTDYLKQTQ